MCDCVRIAAKDKSGDFTDRVHVRGPTEIRGNENSKVLE